jgi:membrane fusion protein, multidrug efflux system
MNNRMTLSLCAVLVVIGCSDSKDGSPASNQSPKKTPLVTVAAASKGEIVHAIELNGTVEAYRLARLASPAEGPVLKVEAREGDAVTAGKTLLVIGRKRGVAALIASLREELQKEKDNLNRTRRLVEGKALPGEELDEAKASFERVRSQLASARESARDYRIAAPFSGLVSRLLVSEGDFVAPRSALAEIYAPATLVLRATVNERYAAMIRTDMPADITLDAYPNRSFTGRISRLYPYLDDRTRARTIEISVDQEVDLLPGMFGRIRLVVESVPDAMTVPVNALLVTPRGASVVFVVKDGKAVQRKVTVGIEDAGRLQILSGVRSGEQVIVSGHEKLKDGAPVRLLGAKGDKKGQEAGPTSDSRTPENAQSGDL